jgi:hypothetical protein
MSARPLTNFAEFWPFYVREHANEKNRRLHVVGTSLGLLAAAALIAAGKPWLALLTPVIGYAFAWFGHFFVQKNRPATFTYPLWSLCGDFKMLGLTILGRMEDEVRLHAGS